MGIPKLAVLLEKSHGIQVKDEDVVPENFQSLNSMVRFVEQKMQSKQAAGMVRYVKDLPDGRSQPFLLRQSPRPHR